MPEVPVLGDRHQALFDDIFRHGGMAFEAEIGNHFRRNRLAADPLRQAAEKRGQKIGHHAVDIHSNKHRDNLSENKPNVKYLRRERRKFSLLTPARRWSKCGGGRFIMSEEMKKKVLEQLDRPRLIEIAKNVAEIVSITGEESAIAHYLGGEFERLGMEVRYQEVEEGRPNVIGALNLLRRKDSWSTSQWI